MTDTLFNLDTIPTRKMTVVRNTGNETSPIPRHRLTDPETSRIAARRAAGRGVEQAILDVFGQHWELTDDELVRLLPDRNPPTVKSARSRLVRSGHLQNTGRIRTSSRGCPMTVWRLA